MLKSRIFITGVSAAVLGSIFTVVIHRCWDYLQTRIDHRILHEVKVKPVELKKSFLIFESKHDATQVDLTISNVGRKASHNLKVLVQFKSPIIFIYTPPAITVRDTAGKTLSGWTKVFRKELAAGLTIETLAPSIKIKISFVLDRRYSLFRSKDVIDLINLTSHQP